MQKFAPIALFVYNRAEHTRRTIEHLRQNTLATDSRLYIFSDAAKESADEQAVEEVRELIHEATGFRSVKVINRKEHMGLAKSLISGISNLVQDYGKVIVFEDDLLSSPHCLTYFNQALERYAAEERVMQIAAYMFPAKDAHQLPETFFIRSVSSWGWATWKRAWQHFESDAESLYQQFDHQKIQRFNFGSTMNYWQQLLDFRIGKNDSWAIRWHASVFLNNGLVLQPSRSLIENIGHDGSGVHSIIEDTYQVHLHRQPITVFPDEIEENERAAEVIQQFYKNRKGSILKRIRKFLVNKWFRWKNLYKS